MEETLEEDSSVMSYIMRTNQECARCGDYILRTDEVFLLTVVRPDTTDGFQYVPIQADDGDFLYEPRIFSVECWEDIAEDIRRALEDIPPVLDPRSILECSFCESGIRVGEVLGLVTFGEVHCSKRTPEGAATDQFQNYDTNPIHLCVACLRFMNDDVCSVWEGEVQQDNECKEGTYLRCWRFGCVGKTNCMRGNTP